MLKMRLQRIGRKNNPSYRVLVVDSRQGPKSGKFVDTIGSYNPKTDHIALDGEKARAWIGKGVQVSPTVHNLLVSQKIIEGKKINVLPRKSPIKKKGEDARGASARLTENVSEQSEANSPVSGQHRYDEAVEATVAAPTAEVPVPEAVPEVDA